MANEYNKKPYIFITTYLIISYVKVPNWPQDLSILTTGKSQ